MRFSIIALVVLALVSGSTGKKSRSKGKKSGSTGKKSRSTKTSKSSKCTKGRNDSPSKVLILASVPFPEFADDVQAKLDSLNLFSQVDLISGVNLATPDNEMLQEYDSVLVYSDTDFANRDTMGNVLAEYVDNGGCLSVATFALSSPSLGLGGRFLTDGYLPVTQGPQDQFTPLTLVPVLPDHPLLEAVTSFNGGTSSYHNIVTVVPGATLVANWSNDLPLVVFKDHVVALNFYPASSDARDDFWDATTDGARLMANSLFCNKF
jgi:hypothetical protein